MASVASMGIMVRMASVASVASKGIMVSMMSVAISKTPVHFVRKSYVLFPIKEDMCEVTDN
jgi:hypothetical protein